MKLTAAVLAALIIAALVSGCGGGGGGGGTGTITGNVIAAGTSAPLQGVLVTVIQNNRTTTTDAEGNFTISGLTPGNYTFRFTKDTFEPRDRPVAVAAGDNPPLGQITMLPVGTNDPPGQTQPRTIEGKALLSGQTDHSGITVELLEGSDVVETKTTTANGSYSFWIWAGSYTIRFTKAGYTQAQTTATVVNLDEIVQVPTVTLQP